MTWKIKKNENLQIAENMLLFIGESVVLTGFNFTPD